MKNSFLLIIYLITIVLFSCSGKTSSNAKNKSMVIATDADKVQYQCPMKCEGDTSYTTEGQCPVCNMNLEKK